MSERVQADTPPFRPVPPLPGVEALSDRRGGRREEEEEEAAAAASASAAHGYSPVLTAGRWGRAGAVYLSLPCLSSL